MAISEKGFVTNAQLFDLRLHRLQDKEIETSIYLELSRALTGIKQAGAISEDDFNKILKFVNRESDKLDLSFPLHDIKKPELNLLLKQMFADQADLLFSADVKEVNTRNETTFDKEKRAQVKKLGTRAEMLVNLQNNLAEILLIKYIMDDAPYYNLLSDQQIEKINAEKDNRNKQQLLVDYTYTSNLGQVLYEKKFDTFIATRVKGMKMILADVPELEQQIDDFNQKYLVSKKSHENIFSRTKKTNDLNELFKDDPDYNLELYFQLSQLLYDHKARKEHYR